MKKKLKGKGEGRSGGGEEGPTRRDGPKKKSTGRSVKGNAGQRNTPLVKKTGNEGDLWKTKPDWGAWKMLGEGGDRYVPVTQAARD